MSEKPFIDEDLYDKDAESKAPLWGEGQAPYIPKHRPTPGPVHTDPVTTYEVQRATTDHGNEFEWYGPQEAEPEHEVGEGPPKHDPVPERKRFKA